MTSVTPPLDPGTGEPSPDGVAGWYHRANKKILFGIIIVVITIAALMATSLRGSLTYFQTVDELKLRGASAVGEQYRVGGRVKTGTIEKDAQNNLDFVIYHNQTSNSLPVHYRGIVPDIFGEEVDVIVEGRWNADGIFYASNLVAQHPDEFRAVETGGEHDPVEDRDYAD